MQNAIDVRNLNTYFSNKQVLKDINISFEKNTITSLIGPSGCGKSTFLRTLNRMNDLVPGFRKEGDNWTFDKVVKGTTDIVRPDGEVSRTSGLASLDDRLTEDWLNNNMELVDSYFRGDDK